MIFTLTPNPAIDLNVSVGSVVPNTVCRTRNAVYTPNGKGLNVSFTLHRFGVHAPIIGFFGGFSGDFIVDGARAMGCEVKPVRVEGITRINYFLSTEDGTGDEYKFPNSGCRVDRPSQMELLDLIDGLCDLECLVVSGSLPPGVEPEFLDEVFDRVKARGGEVVLDISHPHLASLVRKAPLLVKPNEGEAAAIFGTDCSTQEGAVRAVRDICALGAQNGLLTLGKRGAYFSDGNRVWYASAAPVRQYSSACAGDAALGAFLSVWHDDRSAVEEALVRAMATGADVAQSAGLGDLSHVRELGEKVRVEIVSA